MKVIKTRLDFESLGVPRPEIHDCDILSDWVVNAISRAYPNGLNVRQHRMLFNIVGKLEGLAESVSLEDAEYQFVRDALSSATFPPENNKVLNLIYNVFGVD